MNYEQYNDDWNGGMTFLMNSLQQATSWFVFIVFLPITWPLSKLGQYRRERLERFDREHRQRLARDWDGQ